MKKVFVTFMVMVSVCAASGYGQFSPEVYMGLFGDYISEFDTTGFVFYNSEVLEPGTIWPIFKTASQGDFVQMADLDMVLREQFEDEILHMVHYKYQETYHDIPIEGAEHTEHADDGYVVYSNSKFVPDIAGYFPDPSPIVVESEALGVVLSVYQDNLFAWEDPAWEDQIQEDLGDPFATNYPVGELMFAIADPSQRLGFLVPGASYVLAWKFEVISLAPSFHKDIYVNAMDGTIFREDDLMDANSAWIWASSTYQRAIDTDHDGTNYILLTDENDRNVHTKKYEANLSGQERAWGNINEVEDADDAWDVADIDATSVHWFASEAWDYFKARFNRNGPRDDGKEVRVFYDWSGMDAAHDFKNGREYIYFDLDRGQAIDVIGHEFSHGVTKKAGLGIYWEHGALNESFCDIFGSMIQKFAYNVMDWEMGENFNPIIRSLADPNSAGEYCEDNEPTCPTGVGNPDTYEGDFWYTGTHDAVWDDGGIHTNAGVQNKWFYILAHGENGINDNTDSFSVQGIGEDEAAIITYLNLIVNMHHYSNYADARRGAIAIADQRYGNDPCAFERVQVQNAWYAVGLGEESLCPVGISSASHISKAAPLVYPNPSSGKFEIAWEKALPRSFEVLDAVGRVLFSEDNRTMKIREIDLSQFPKGIYFVRISEKTGKYTIKLMLQ